MSNTLPSIKLKSELWVNVYSLVSIDHGKPLEIQNTGTTDLYYSIAENEPERDSIKYKIFKRSETVVFNDGDINIWFFSPQANGLINVNDFVSSAKETIDAILSSIENLTNKISDQNDSILLELRLLNARFEEMADTSINEKDIEGIR